MEIKRFIYESRDDWKKFRKGLFTASRINELMANPKGDAKISTGAYSYIYDLISDTEAEGKMEYYSPSMERGNEEEPQAVLKYGELRGLDVNDDNFIYTSIGGFVFFVADEMFGGTPDIILDDRICEIKCPDSDTHLYYLTEVTEENFKKELPKYYDQVQLNMLLCGKPSCDFISYDSRFKNEKLQMLIINIKEDKQRQNDIVEKIKIAHEIKNQIINKLK